MEGQSQERQLLSIKKELKCWESMFERRHGRKPSKADIEESPSEIKVTYRQYQNLKKKISSSKEGKVIPATVTDDSSTAHGGGEVFGSFLNKKSNENVLKDTTQHGCSLEKRSTWKLRRWNKVSGYKTVMMSREKEVCAENEEIKTTETQDMKPTQAQIEVDELNTLAPLPSATKNLIDNNETETCEMLNIAGGYHKVPSRKERRLKYNWGVSNKWLERCKPDLTGLGDDLLDGAKVNVTLGTDTKNENTLSGGHCEEDLDKHCEDSVKDSSFTESDSSGDAPSIMSLSQEQMLTELSQSFMGRTGIDVESQLEVPAKSEATFSESLFDIIDTPVSHHSQQLGPNVCEVKQDKLNVRPLSSESLPLKTKSLPKMNYNCAMVENSITKSNRRTHDNIRHRCDNNLSTLCSTSASTNQRITSPCLRTSNPPSKPEIEDNVQSGGNGSTEYLKDDEYASSESGVSVKDISVAKDTTRTSTTANRTSTNVSENFVRLNMKVRRYSRRPGKALSGSAYKRQAWKKNQKSRSGASGSNGGKGGGRNVCFKCGKPGHWAKNCTDKGGSKNLGSFAGEKVKFSEEMALGIGEEMDKETLEELAEKSPFPSVKDAAMMATGMKFENIIDGKMKKQEVVQNKSNTVEEEIVDESKSSWKMSSTYIAPPPCHAPSSTPPPTSIEPLYPPVDGKIIATPRAVYTTLKKFGHTDFRAGQEEAIMRILSGISTIVIHSTGSGKSLCYQLPAYLYSQAHSPCVTLVISPLVSLMEDQVRNFPPGLKGTCLHTNQTQTQREKVLCDVVEGRVDVLLLSPEALVGGALWSRRGGSVYSLKQLPPVAFACIDEVHCVSEWSHNFRPSYLRIYKVLQERLGVRCLLGLTATATHATALSVAQHLCVDENNIIRGHMLPDNLYISVSCDQDRDQALVKLLQSSRFCDCESIIVYCTRQQQTERVAQLLRTCLQSTSSGWNGEMNYLECDIVENARDIPTRSRKRKNCANSTAQNVKKRKLEWTAESYHAGMSASQRKRVQNDFMTGRLRIVVATVAFGMGLNKADVRAIVHYNIPKNFESFVQEIGRAGRDGMPAFCHVFIDKEGKDLSELRRHAYSNTVDPYAIKHLIRKTFPVCKCQDQKQSSSLYTHDLSTDASHSPPKLATPRWCAGHEVTIPIETTVQKLDVKEECISTLLCYLELQGWLEVMNVVNDMCTLKCYDGPRQLRALAQKVPAVAAAAARLRENGTDLDFTGNLSFSVVGVADSMCWESHIVRSELSDLQYNDRGTNGTSGRTRSTVLVEFDTLSFHLRSPGDLTPEERDYICQFLCDRVRNQEEREVEKLHLLHASLRSVACNNHYECLETDFVQQEALGITLTNRESEKMCRLKELIKCYFSSEGLDLRFLESLGISVLSIKDQKLSSEYEQQIERDIHSLMAIHNDCEFTGRSIARIFHGIASPCFPAEVWGRQHRYWRRYLDVDFNLLCRISTRKLLELR